MLQIADKYPFATCHKLSLIAPFFLLSSLEWFDSHFFTWSRARILAKSSILKTKFDFSISKSKLHFLIEAIFQTGSLNLKSKLHFKIEAPIRELTSISKSNLHFEIEAPFRNRSSISKSNVHFEIEALFLNRSTIWKSQLHF